MYYFILLFYGWTFNVIPRRQLETKTRDFYASFFLKREHIRWKLDHLCKFEHDVAEHGGVQGRVCKSAIKSGRLSAKLPNPIHTLDQHHVAIVFKFAQVVRFAPDMCHFIRKCLYYHFFRPPI